jgi:TonB-dependent SusC/RagA subfamily outer membrane receptor
MARRLHLAVEGDCDARVLARGISAKRYGNLLLQVASCGQGLSALAPALAEGGHTFLERRLWMIRSTVRKHRFGAAVLAFLGSAGFVVLACETPTPPAARTDTDVILETSVPARASASVDPEVPLDNPLLTEPLAEADEGFYLVKKTGGKVQYVQPVSPDQVELIRENPETPTRAFIVREDGAHGPITLIRERRAEDPGDPKVEPLIYVDGVRMENRDFLKTLNPDDIARIEVIKGGAARAQYGEQAAGGVILITLKH